MSRKVSSGINKIDNDTLYIGSGVDGYKTIIANISAAEGYKPSIMWNNSDWVKSVDGYTFDVILSGTVGVSDGGTGITSYTINDMLYATGSNTLGKLAAGPDGYLLKSVSGIPTWSQISLLPSGSENQYLTYTSGAWAASSDIILPTTGTRYIKPIKGSANTHLSISAGDAIGANGGGSLYLDAGVGDTGFRGIIAVGADGAKTESIKIGGFNWANPVLTVSNNFDGLTNYSIRVDRSARLYCATGYIDLPGGSGNIANNFAIANTHVNNTVTAAALNTLTGGGSTTLHSHAHNTTTGIQGGTTNEYYHLTSTQHGLLTTSFSNPDGYLTFTDGYNPSGVSLSSLVPSAAGFSNVIYVDKAGNDATGERGNFGKPFLTIAAAMAVAQSGDVVRLGPGTWSERVTFPDSDVSSLALVGSGIGATAIEYADGEMEPAINIHPTSPMDRVLIQDLTVGVPGTGNAISVSGGVAAITLLTVQNVRWWTDNSSGSIVERVIESRVVGCNADTIGFGGCMKVTVAASTFEQTSSVQWLDSDTAYWGSDFNDTTFAGCNISAFYARGAACVAIVGCLATGIVVDPVLYGASTHGTLTTSGSTLGTVIISAIADTSRVATLDGCSMESLTVTRASGTDDLIVSAVNATCVAEPIIGTGCSVDMRWNTPDGGIAIPMLWSGSQASRQGEVVQLAEKWEIDGETVPGQINSIMLSGVTMSNSDYGRVYITIEEDGTDNMITIWSDAARTIGVATGIDSLKGGGNIIVGDIMGMYGTINIDTGALPDNTAYATLTTSDAVETITSSTNILGRPFFGVMYTEGNADGYSVWVVTEGSAKILTYDGAAAAGYLYLDTPRAYPDSGKVDCEPTRTTKYENNGLGRALERVTSGLVLARLDLRGFGPVLGS